MECNKPLVSVIVPIYKVEKFMDKCIYSIIGQTYKNLEIVLVDDGSPDRSGYKSDVWGKKDERIRVIHQKNAGVSAARNSGISCANGKYLIFVDSDDWLPINAIEQLVSNAEDYNTDLVIGVAVSVGILEKKYYGLNTGLLIDLNNSSQLIELSNLIKTQLSPWAKLYKRHIIEEMALRFPLGIAYGEDGIFNWRYLKHCKTISAIPSTVYIYSQLNLSRACGQYYDNINEWMGVAVKCYSQLFSSNTVDEKYNVLSTAEERFSYCCEHYCDHLSNDVVMCQKKIKETQLIFKNVIKEYLDIENNLNNMIFFQNNQKQWVWYDDINKLYDVYSMHTTSSMQLLIKRIIRNIIVKAKQFWLYKVNKKSKY